MKHLPALVLRPGALGDTIVTLPLLARLRLMHGGLTAVVPGKTHALVASCIAGVRTMDADGLDAMPLYRLDTDPAGVPLLREHGLKLFFLAVHASETHDAWRHACSGTLLLADPAPPVGVHAARHLMRRAGMPDSDPLRLPDLRMRESLLQEARARLQTAAGRCLFVHPGSGGAGKNWHLEGFVRVIRAMQVRAVIMAPGPADQSVTAQFLQALPAGVHARVFRDMDVMQTAALLCCARMYMGNDSGISHLAALCNVPSLVMFGPTCPDNWQPLGANVHVCVSAHFPVSRRHAGAPCACQHHVPMSMEEVIRCARDIWHKGV